MKRGEVLFWFSYLILFVRRFFQKQSQIFLLLNNLISIFAKYDIPKRQREIGFPVEPRMKRGGEDLFWFSWLILFDKNMFVKNNHKYVSC